MLQLKIVSLRELANGPVAHNFHTCLVCTTKFVAHCAYNIHNIHEKRFSFHCSLDVQICGAFKKWKSWITAFVCLLSIRRWPNYSFNNPKPRLLSVCRSTILVRTLLLIIIMMHHACIIHLPFIKHPNISEAFKQWKLTTKRWNKKRFGRFLLLLHHFVSSFSLHWSAGACSSNNDNNNNVESICVCFFYSKIIPNYIACSSVENENSFLN